MRGKRRKNNKNRLYKRHSKCHITSTGKGNYRRLQAQADSEERAIPPDGFTVFSPGQCSRVRQSINGRTMFAPTICVANAVKATKSHLHKQHIECHIASTGKGNYRRLQAQADSEERAIPPDGFWGVIPRAALPGEQGYQWYPPALSGIPLFKGDERLLRPDGHLL